MASSRDQQIRSAARRVFARKGYENTNVEDVAAAAEVSKGTIYTYFDRKEDLLGAVHHDLLDEMEGRIETVLASDRPPLEKIRVMLHDFVEVVGSHDEAAQVMLDIWAAGMRHPERFDIDFGVLYADYRALLRDLLAEAEARGDVPDDLPPVTPALLIGAIDGVFLQWLLDPDALSFPEAADDLIDLLYRGIETRGAS